ALTGGTWTFTLDQSAVQDLDAGDVVQDTYTFTASDGSTQQVTVTITGTDDASVIAGTFTGSVTEDGILVASGSLTITDPDLSDNPSFSDVPNISGDNGFGTFTLTSGVWTYTLDNNHPSVQALNN